jgi:hypothetical protein
MGCKGDFDSHTGYREKNFMVSGDHISLEDMEHFTSIIHEMQKSTSCENLLRIVKSKLGENASTRNSSLYETALEFVADNWHLIESGLRTSEQLFAIGALIFEEVLPTDIATELAHLDMNYDLQIVVKTDGSITIKATCTHCLYEKDSEFCKEYHRIWGHLA